MITLPTLIEQIKGESHTLGVDIGSQAIKAVLTHHFADGRIEVEKATLVELRKGVIRDGQIASEEASKDPDGALEGITPRQWIRRTLDDVYHRLGVNPQDVDLCVSPPWSGGLLIDHFQISEKNDPRLEAQKRPPFDGSDIILDHQVIGHVTTEDNRKMVDVLFAAARDRVIHEWGSLFREAKSDPMAFDADIFAQFNAWSMLYETEEKLRREEEEKKNPPEKKGKKDKKSKKAEEAPKPEEKPAEGEAPAEGEKPAEGAEGAGGAEEASSHRGAIALLCVGMQRVVVTFVIDGQFHSSREVTGASLTAFERTLARRANFPPDQDVDALLRDETLWPETELFRLAFRQASSDLGTGVQQAIQYFYSATANTNIDKVLLCGGGACIPGIAAMLGKKIHLPVEVFDPLATFPPTKLAAIGPNESPLLATAFGLSIRRF